MKINKIIGFYYLAVGIGIIGLWTMLYVSKQIPELETEPAAIAFHIFIEIAMGVMAIITALSILKRKKSSLTLMLITSGMLMYSVVNSSGYYAETGEYGMIAMFGIIFLFTIAAVRKYKQT